MASICIGRQDTFAHLEGSFFCICWQKHSEQGCLDVGSRHKVERVIYQKTNFVLNDKLDRLIRFYISLRLGTPAVERGLSALQDCLEKHDGPLSDEVCYNLVLLKLDGPKSEKNICSRDASSQQWIFSDFSRMCQQLYLERYGRRFCSIYSKSKQQMEDNNNIPASKPSRKFKGCKPKLGCCFVININQ